MFKETRPDPNNPENKVTLPTEIDESCLDMEPFSRWDPKFEMHRKFYDEALSEHWHSDAWIHVKAGQTFLSFEIRTSITGEVRKPVNLIFVLEPDNRRLHFSHRWVETKDYGISGSEVLAKAESIIEKLRTEDRLDVDSMYMSAGQQKVIDWALKNGFTFEQEKDETTYQNITEHPENYVHDVTVTNLKGWERTDYVFRKELVDELGLYDLDKMEEDEIKKMLNKGERVSLTKELTRD